MLHYRHRQFAVPPAPPSRDAVPDGMRPQKRVAELFKLRFTFDVQHLPGAVASGVKAVVERPPFSLCNNLMCRDFKIYRSKIIQNSGIAKATNFWQLLTVVMFCSVNFFVVLYNGRNQLRHFHCPSERYLGVTRYSH